jgi:uncharacterized membrane protein
MQGEDVSNGTTQPIESNKETSPSLTSQIYETLAKMAIYIVAALVVVAVLYGLYLLGLYVLNLIAIFITDNWMLFAVIGMILLGILGAWAKRYDY